MRADEEHPWYMNNLPVASLCFVGAPQGFLLGLSLAEHDAMLAKLWPLLTSETHALRTAVAFSQYAAGFFELDERITANLDGHPESYLVMVSQADLYVAGDYGTYSAMLEASAQGLFLTDEAHIALHYVYSQKVRMTKQAWASKALQATPFGAEIGDDLGLAHALAEAVLGGGHANIGHGMVAIKCVLASNATLLQEVRLLVEAGAEDELHYFILEVLRLYPPADMPAYLDEDGTPVLRDLYAYHRNPVYFAQPLVFDWRRYAERPEELAHLNVFNELHPNRACPGKNASLIAFRIYTREIVQYDIDCHCKWHGRSLDYYWDMPVNGSCVFTTVFSHKPWVAPRAACAVALTALAILIAAQPLGPQSGGPLRLNPLPGGKTLAQSLCSGHRGLPHEWCECGLSAPVGPNYYELCCCAPHLTQAATAIWLRHRLLVMTHFVAPVSDTGEAATIPHVSDAEFMSVAIQDLHYYAPNGAHLLRGVTAVINPGELIAVMGPSGSGKTTLLDVLSGRRAAGTVEGRLLVNGADVHIAHRSSARFTAFVSHVGYMLQLANSFCESLTVRENLIYAALLRLPAAMPISEKVARADALLHTLQLGDTAHVRVGGDVGGGISGGQKRKLQLGMEMLPLPQLLILDEPTSGLDTRSALSVINTLHRYCDSGRSIALSIHQPRVEIFGQFDKMLLLHRGGVAFVGTPLAGCTFLVELGTYVGAGDCEGGGAQAANPADAVLDILSQGGSRPSVEEAEGTQLPSVVDGPSAKAAKVARSEVGNFAVAFNKSWFEGQLSAAICRAADMLVDETMEAAALAALADGGATEGLTTLWMRVWVGISRQLLSLSYASYFTSCAHATAAAGFNLMVFWRTNVIIFAAASLNSTVFMSAFLLVHGVVQFFSASLSRFYTYELAAGKASPLQFWLQQLLFLTPWAALSASVFGVGMNLGVFALSNAEGALALSTLLVIVTAQVWVAFFCLCTAGCYWAGARGQRLAHLATTIVSTLLGPLVLFMGFVMSPSQALAGIRWCFYVTPGFYSFAALMRINLQRYTSGTCANEDVECLTTTSGDAILDLYGFGGIDLSAYLFALLGWWVALSLTTLGVLQLAGGGGGCRARRRSLHLPQGLAQEPPRESASCTSPASCTSRAVFDARKSMQPLSHMVSELYHAAGEGTDAAQGSSSGSADAAQGSSGGLLASKAVKLSRETPPHVYMPGPNTSESAGPSSTEERSAIRSQMRAHAHLQIHSLTAQLPRLARISSHALPSLKKRGSSGIVSAQGEHV